MNETVLLITSYKRVGKQNCRLTRCWMSTTTPPQSKLKALKTKPEEALIPDIKSQRYEGH